MIESWNLDRIKGGSLSGLTERKNADTVGTPHAIMP